MTPLDHSPYSYHWTVLRFLGSWPYGAKTTFRKKMYVTYRVIVTGMELYGVFGLVSDLYLTAGDMKKITWNLCVTTLLVGVIIKNIQLLHRYQTIDGLRLMLHWDAESRQTPEDVYINNLALKEMKFLHIYYYGTAGIFIPTWFFARYSKYYYGIPELPIPFRIPEAFDLNDPLQFHFVYFSLSVGSIFGMILAMETELAMYSLMIQISREYRILVKDIPKINRLYDDDEEDESIKSETRLRKKEVNPWLKKVKTNLLVKKFSARQEKIIQYTQDFESCFNKPFLQEFFGSSVMVVALALQCLWESVDFSGDLIYQIGYLLVSVINMFFICLFSTRLRTQCLEVGFVAYSTLWYRMETEVQKDIGMMIMRSQHPPKITMGKFMELSLSAFMNIMKYLYSWLALFRQLESPNAII